VVNVFASLSSLVAAAGSIFLMTFFQFHILPSTMTTERREKWGKMEQHEEKCGKTTLSFDNGKNFLCVAARLLP